MLQATQPPIATTPSPTRACAAAVDLSTPADPRLAGLHLSAPPPAVPRNGARRADRDRRPRRGALTNGRRRLATHLRLGDQT
ncbi:hypothetical protein RMN57_06185 [Kitasatospora sp. CM 4170]|uniref:Uncharacterized protein n=1 Tax=Kitasatospora aburaviensis TaxID=67265 RepID=A0ABW1EXW8_9ACTN|nr:hypothetical protein [Kitasatospora sp. CM 4170]WNM44323.1 hypothetical protein RMN57_06185 [Kitasatospora sp. CM 4170]